MFCGFAAMNWPCSRALSQMCTIDKPSNADAIVHDYILFYSRHFLKLGPKHKFYILLAGIGSY